MATSARGAELRLATGEAGSWFGISSVSGNNAVVSAPWMQVGANANQGTAVLFRGLDSLTSVVTEHVTLRPSDITGDDAFGYSAAMDGNIVVAGATSHKISGQKRGAAYVFRNLGTATGTIQQSLKLVASDGRTGDSFGHAASLIGSRAIIGDFYHSTYVSAYGNEGAAYLYRDVDTSSGTKTESARLVSDTGFYNDEFGRSISQASWGALIGSPGVNGHTGSVLVFRNLDTASGTTYPVARLSASDGQGAAYFGISSAISGTDGLVGAYWHRDANYNQVGAVYYFRALDTATGTKTQTAKLVPRSGAQSSEFGASVGLAEDIAMVGEPGSLFLIGEPSPVSTGAVHLFTGMSSRTGTVREDVRIHTSNGQQQDRFGYSLDLDGDRFVIGSIYGDGSVTNSGNAWTGRVSTFTTLDGTGRSQCTGGLSFQSYIDWVIGMTGDSNTLTVDSTDRVKILNNSVVYIGRDAGSDHNILRIEGGLDAGAILIGNNGNNTGNTLHLASGASIAATYSRLAHGNSIHIGGGTADINQLLTALSNTLQVWDGEAWITVTTANHSSLVTITAETGYRRITPTNPTSYALWAGISGIPSAPADGDADGDSLPNLLEYALEGKHPRKSDLPNGTWSGQRLTFRKNPLAVANGDVTYIFETSSDMGVLDPWKPAISGVQQNTTSISCELPRTEMKNFMRLKVTAAP